MSYSNADLKAGLIPPKVIENGVVVVVPGLQVGEMTLKEHQEYLVWLKMQKPLTRQEAIQAGHRPKEVYEYFGPLVPELEAKPTLELVATSDLPKSFGLASEAMEGFRQLHEDVTGVKATDLVADSRAQGYTGDACADCGNFTMVNNGTCLVCVSCGRTTGCS